MSKVKAEQVLEAFIKTRDEIDTKKKALKTDLAELEQLQSKRLNWLDKEMGELGVDSLKKEGVGTCFVSYKESVSVADRDEFINWIKENDEDFNFLTISASKTAVKQCVEDGGTIPPGLNYTKIKAINVRRA